MKELSIFSFKNLLYKSSSFKYFKNSSVALNNTSRYPPLFFITLINLSIVNACSNASTVFNFFNKDNSLFNNFSITFVTLVSANVLSETAFKLLINSSSLLKFSNCVLFVENELTTSKLFNNFC